MIKKEKEEIEIKKETTNNNIVPIVSNPLINKEKKIIRDLQKYQKYQIQVFN